MTGEPDAVLPSACVLAIDPGGKKCGVAVVGQDGTILHRAIVPTEDVAAHVRQTAALFAPDLILLGDGTGSKPLRKALQQSDLPAALVVVDETRTSEMGRARWVRENPPRGLHVLLPRFLRTPTEAYDDWVAVILAERWWQTDSQRPA